MFRSTEKSMNRIKQKVDTLEQDLEVKLIELTENLRKEVDPLSKFKKHFQALKKLEANPQELQNYVRENFDIERKL